jgi:hypothetical protein
MVRTLFLNFLIESRDIDGLIWWNVHCGGRLSLIAGLFELACCLNTILSIQNIVEWGQKCCFRCRVKEITQKSKFKQHRA